MSAVDWHREMLADHQRVRAFAGAVRRAVQPGDVVVDVGTGSGLLAMVAARAGASRVYAIERGAIASVARKIAADNGLDRCITFLEGSAASVELGERADLVVGEIIGSFGVDEGILSVYADAAARFLKPRGRLLPDALDLRVAPAEYGLDLWSWPQVVRREWGLDMQRLAALAQDSPTSARIEPGHLLAQGTTVLRVALGTAAAGPLEGAAEFALSRSGRLSGWAAWFAARYRGEVILCTAPPNPAPSWTHCFFPTGSPCDLPAGAQVSARFRLDDPFWSWELRLPDTAPRNFTQFDGVLEGDLRPPGGGT
ncbi:MAG: 50S ribosomal protein L11 methyltransferase [Gemmatimonadota bacterium]